MNEPVPASAPPTIARLKTYPFFDRLADVILGKVQPHLAERSVHEGDVLLRLGEYSDAAYYIVDGAIEIRMPRAATGQSHGAYESVLLNAGELFGEIGALSRYPVTADCIATTDTNVLMIRTPALRLLMKQRDLGFKKFVDDRYRSRTLVSHLKRVAIFDGLSDDTIQRLRDRAELLSYDPGASIVEQDSGEQALYLVRGGHVKLSVRASSIPEGHASVTYLRTGEYAGDITLLTGKPWPFSMTAIEHVEIVRISRDDLDAMLLEKPAIAHLLRDSASERERQIAGVVSNPSASRHLQMAVDRGLINGQSVLLIDMATCTGCDDCVRACADTHGGQPRFVRQGAVYERWNIPLACYQCSDPVCMIGCPTGAITRPLGGLAVTINAQTCIGCGNCATRCPWHNIVPVRTFSDALGREIELATKCDLCSGRPEGPACVQMCPHGSATRISFQDPAAIAKTFGKSARPA